jgi:hypothetical protein
VKRIFSILFALALSLGVIALPMAETAHASPGTIQVDDDAPGCVAGHQSYPYSVTYCNIQDAIDDANPGDTVMVAEGLYKENVVIDKSLTLEGAWPGVDARTRTGAETIIEPDDGRGIEIVSAADRVVVIDGLTVRNVRTGIAAPHPIGEHDITDIRVKNVRVLNCIKGGITMAYATTAMVEHCYVEGTEYGINAGALEALPPTVANFTNSEIVNAEFGITGYLADSLIEGNLIRDFAGGGIGISGQFLDTEVKNNTVTGYVKGVAMTFEYHEYRDLSRNVTVKANNFTGNQRGIYVWPDQAELEEITVNFNNIDNFLSGVRNDADEALDATRNWWGDSTGPLHLKLNRDGTGNSVSDNVDFEPWLGAPLVSVKTQPVTESDNTVDAKKEADTEVAVNGTAIVTVVRYAGNPNNAPACFASLDKYIDVYVPDSDDVTEVGIRLYYTNDELTAAGINKESLRLFSWNGTAWVQCSDSGINATSSGDYSGYIWAQITGDTTPTLAQLTGTPFAGYGPRFQEFSIGTAELADGQDKEAYEARLEACAGTRPYIWAITGGALPDGLGLDPDTGVISGTPTRDGVFDFSVTVTDDDGNEATVPLSITIREAGVCFIATAAYGTDTAKEIDILREFRDAVLLPNSLGSQFVCVYYEISPPIAGFISRHEVLGTAARVGFVDPIVKILNWSRDLWSKMNSQ